MNPKFFTATSNLSCRKAMQWMDENNVPYEEKNLSTTPITVEEIQDILSLTNEGTEDIIAKKSKAFKKLKVDIDALSLSQLYEVIIKNPGVLRLPIIHDETRLQIGYNDEDIRQFLPRWFRLNQLKKILSISET